MVKTRKERAGQANIKLRQPDRSAPTEKTLLDLADERNLLEQVKQREKELARLKKKKQAHDDDEDSDSDSDDDDDGEAPVLSATAEHGLEAALWTVSIAMLHFTFDVLVQNQYGREINWVEIVVRSGRAWLVFLFLFYFLHPFEPNAVLIPGLPVRYQRHLRQATFFVMSVVSGCYLIFVTNSQGYLATMKQAPPLGCLWIWSVVELDLLYGCISLLLAALFLKQGGYDIK